MTTPRNRPLHAPAELAERALFEVKRVIVGQDRMIERVMVCLLARGHCLLEGGPGLAKTLTVETLAKVVGGTFTPRTRRGNAHVDGDVRAVRHCGRRRATAHPRLHGVLFGQLE